MTSTEAINSSGEPMDDEVAEYLSSLVTKLLDKNRESITNLRQISPLMTLKGNSIQFPEKLVLTLCSLLEEVMVIDRFRHQICHVLRSVLLHKPTEDRQFKDPACRGVVIGSSLQPSEAMINQVLMCALNGDSNIESPLQSVICLCRVVMDYFDNLTSDQVNSLSSRYCEWLRNASTQQAVNPTSVSLFKKGDMTKPMTEIDGSVSNEFFTVLNVCQYYTVDQYINMYCFSTLLSCLVHTTPDNIDRKLRSRLYDVSVDYCLRIIDQWEKKPKVESDREVQNAAILEAISILDQICLLSKAYVPKVFEVIKRLYSRIQGEPALTQILIRIMQVFLNHGDGIMYNYDQALESFFGEVLAKHYVSTDFAFDTIMFIEDNLDKLLTTSVLQKFFPNILKILAYNPTCFLREFVQILPAFLAPSTVSELLHSLLDLPCMSAIMCRPQSLSTSFQDSSGDMTAALQRPLFNFMMRVEGGQGDTINKLADVHRYLSESSSHPRVFTTSQTVPVLLRVYFNVVMPSVSLKTANLLLPLILERSSLLYAIEEFKHDVLRILADNLLELFKHQPELLVDQQSELQEFVSGLRNVKDKEDFFIHLIWIIGEYCSSSYLSNCTPEMTSSFYETIECLAYEICGQRGEEHMFSARLILTLMSTLVKLASRCQDLIPRVLLCLTKLSQQHDCVEDQGGVILDYATQLFSLLKLPNVASEVLSPSKDMNDGRYHYDNTSLSSLFHMMTTLQQDSTGYQANKPTQ